MMELGNQYLVTTNKLMDLNNYYQCCLHYKERYLDFMDLLMKVQNSSNETVLLKKKKVKTESSLDLTSNLEEQRNSLDHAM